MESAAVQDSADIGKTHCDESFGRRARVIVIGGGVAGCSIAYHLAGRGWGGDTILLEKAEIGTGASGFAAGDLPQFSESHLVSRLCSESISLYHKLEEETGQPVGWHETGGLRFALSSEELRDFRRHIGRSEHLGIRMELIDRDAIKALCPFINMDGILGGIYTHGDGHIDPASVTMAFALGARMKGVRIIRGTRVSDLTYDAAADKWRLETNKGNFESDIVVNAAGYGAVQVSALAGHHLPMTLHENQYIISERVPEVVELGRDFPQLRDMGAPFYARREGDGILCSAYEARPVFRDPAALPEGCLAPDLDRSLEVLARCMDRIPPLGQVGIRAVINQAVMRSPDGNPMLGPTVGQRNFWVASGFGAGFVCGAFGRWFAEWITEGEPSLDLSPFDVRRFASYATRASTRPIIAAKHSWSTDVSYPHGEISAGRPHRTTPLTSVLKQVGAVFGSRQGWEVPLWFAPAGTEARDEPTFGRPNWFDQVGVEVQHAREAGLLELSCLGRFTIKGEGAVGLLTDLCAAPLPGPGFSILTPVITARGGVAALLRLACLSRNDWLMTTWGEAEGRVEQKLRRMAREYDVDVENVSESMSTLVLSGTHADALLAATVTEAERDWKEKGVATRAFIGMAPVCLERADLGGLRSWLIHTPLAYGVAAREALRSVEGQGQPADIGLRAWRTLTIEAGEPLVGLDFGRTIGVAAAGLGHLIDKGDPSLPGSGTSERLVLLSIDVGDALPSGCELVRKDGTVSGITTSVMWSYKAQRSIAFAEVDRSVAVVGMELEVLVLGESRSATVTSTHFFQAGGTTIGH